MHRVDEAARHHRARLRTGVLGAVAAILLLFAAPVASAADVTDPPGGEVRSLHVSTPQNGAVVETATPTFSGTATPGDLIVVNYTPALEWGGTAGTVTVDSEGDWTIAQADFSGASVGTTVFRVTVSAVAPGGEGRPGDVQLDLTFATPPVTSVDLAVLSPQNNGVAGPHLEFAGNGWPGKTVIIDYIDSAGNVRQAGTGTVADLGRWVVIAAFPDEPATTHPIQVTVQQAEADGTRILNTVSLTLTYQPSPSSGDPEVTEPGAAPPAIDAGTQNRPKALAATGGDDAVTLLPVAAVILLSGLGAFMATRRVRAARR
ncbi:hypothetical protein HF576_13935 [Microbacterium sp. CFH 90308]|uniref:LPXTG-motif cell wall-anchored protein n=1 Tax=Microbacterium salsuginis TaxID=2722803 RepID=A0ABX1KF73_9MICO|nr:hypothetical protein [Microbacterium sp. CFH 90308]NLP84948.1 hypothetical protein [Microbacterium sp. CFH 90308]